MKLLIGCLFGSLFYVALADVKNSDENKATSGSKSSIAKPKRDASLLSDVYHGPSYKYLPPSTLSSTYDTYPGKVGSYGGYTGSHISGIGGGGYRTGIGGHGHRHHGYASTGGNRNFAVYHSLDNEPALNFGSGHHGYIFPSINHNVGQGSTQFVRGGYKGVTTSYSGAKLTPNDFSASRPHTIAFANGNPIGSSAAAGAGYHYTKGYGNSYAPVSTGFPSANAFSASTGFGSQEDHHTDHVHNGAPEHVYVVSGLGNSYDSKQTDVYQQQSLPSAAGASFNNKYYTHTTDQAPMYAAGHKGLGHFSFTANKPQVVHASLAGASFQQPFHSKAPFKPSTFLGAKFEGSASGDIRPQQYLPPLEEATGSTGYDFALPTQTYQEANHHHPTVEVQGTALQEPDSAYLPAKNSPDSVYELPSAPSGSYLPPTDSYGNPYSH